MNTDIERIRSALFYLSADMPRDEWAEIAMALKSELGEGGLELFDKWSRQSDKYNTKDVRDTWKSCGPDGGITIATLFFRVKQDGWSYNGARPTPEEIEAGRRESAKRAAEEKAKKARKHAEAAKRATRIWESATPATANPYLARKAVSPVLSLREIDAGAVVELLGYEPTCRNEPLVGRCLVVPIYAGELSTVELIDEAGRKHALAGGKKAGGYWPAQPLPETESSLTILIGEGVATVLSAREATGYCALAALSCSNLKPVATAMRERFPLARLVILADLGNGQRDAEEAAEAANATLALPDFGEERNGLKDFNDMAVHRGLEAVAGRIRQQAPTTTAIDVLEIFRRWQYLPDHGVVYAPLAAVAANLLESDPVWLMTVGPPSGGKTEVIFAISRLHYVRLGAILTEASLLSGTPKKETKAAGGKGGLLKEIGDFGILALKDFTSILAMHRDQRAQLLAALREIFDGSWTRHVGTDGGRTLTWSGKLGLIAGCTAAIDTHHAVMSTMGERFLLYRLPTIDPGKQSQAALANAGREGLMRKELAAAIEGLFAGLDIRGKGLPPIDEDETKRLVALSCLVASARSAVERSPYRGREIELVLDTEAPARLALTLRRLYAGMLAIGLDRETAWPLVAKTGLDCIPKIRRAVLDVLVAAGWLATKMVAARIEHPTTTTRHALEDLSAHGVVVRQPAKKGVGDGKSDMWRLADVARTRFQAIAHKMSGEEEGASSSSQEKDEAIAHKMSDGEKEETSSFSSSSSSNNRYRLEDDLLCAMPKTASECGSQGCFEGSETSDRHCWSCKEEVCDAERCEWCGWIPCSCGACGPECTGGADIEGGV